MLKPSEKRWKKVQSLNKKNSMKHEGAQQNLQPENTCDSPSRFARSVSSNWLVPTAVFAGHFRSLMRFLRSCFSLSQMYLCSA